MSTSQESTSLLPYLKTSQDGNYHHHGLHPPLPYHYLPYPIRHLLRESDRGRRVGDRHHTYPVSSLPSQSSGHGGIPHASIVRQLSRLYNHRPILTFQPCINPRVALTFDVEGIARVDGSSSASAAAHPADPTFASRRIPSHTHTPTSSKPKPRKPFPPPRSDGASPSGPEKPTLGARGQLVRHYGSQRAYSSACGPVLRHSHPFFFFFGRQERRRKR